MKIFLKFVNFNLFGLAMKVILVGYAAESEKHFYKNNSVRRRRLGYRADHYEKRCAFTAYELVLCLRVFSYTGPPQLRRLGHHKRKGTNRT